MSPRRVDAGATVAALGALLLLVSLFLDWYGEDGGGEGVTAWTVFEVLDLLLAGIALLAIATFLRRAGVEPRLPDAPLLVVGSGALVVVVSQLVNDPPRIAGFDAQLETGAWLALAGSALLLAGAFMSVARVSLAVSVAQREDRPVGSPGPGASEAPAGGAPAPGGKGERAPAATADPAASPPAGTEAETVRLPPPERPV